MKLWVRLVIVAAAIFFLAGAKWGPRKQKKLKWAKTVEVAPGVREVVR